MPVYLLQCGEKNGPVKIGWASSVSKRIALFQTGHHETLTLLRTWPGGRPEEASLHRYFADLKLAREWYRYTDEMMVVDIAHLPKVAKRDLVEQDFKRVANQEDGTVSSIVDDLGGVSKAAQLIGVSRPTIYDWKATNRIPGNRLRVMLDLGVALDVVLPLLSDARDTGGREVA